MAEVPHTGSSLLTLPHVLHREVLCFCQDSATVATLLASCTDFHQLRRDPAAAALLLMRLKCRSYSSAVASCDTCEGGTAAVVQQVLQQLRPAAAASSACITPTAPEQLLQALLVASCVSGNSTPVRALVALLPAPPGHRLLFPLVNASRGGHLGVMRTLLDHTPSYGVMCSSIAAAAEQSGLQEPLALLLAHCTAVQLHPKVALHALSRAVTCVNPTALRMLLSHVGHHAAPIMPRLLRDAGPLRDPALIQALLQHQRAALADLNGCLHLAVRAGSAASVAAILDSGADVHSHQDHLRIAVKLCHRVSHGRSVPPAAGGSDPWDLVLLLLQRGAFVSRRMRSFLQRSWREDVQAWL